MEIKEVLTKAADIVEERGLYQGGWYIDPQGERVCAVGALRLAGGGEIHDRGADGDLRFSVREGEIDWATVDGAEMLIQRALTAKGNLPIEVAGGVYTSVPSWSDRKGSSESVAALFREVAAMHDLAEPC